MTADIEVEEGKDFGTLQEELESEGYELPERLDSDFHSLLNLGSLKKSVQLYGHTFYLRTLKSGELLEVSSITASIEGDLGRGKAFMVAVVGASLEAIDGEEVPGVVFKTKPTLYQRYEWLRDNIHMGVIEAIYKEYVALDARAVEVLEAIRGKASSKSE